MKGAVLCNIRFEHYSTVQQKRLSRLSRINRAKFTQGPHMQAFSLTMAVIFASAMVRVTTILV